jgi:hypothetical protein
MLSFSFLFKNIYLQLKHNTQTLTYSAFFQFLMKGILGARNHFNKAQFEVMFILK